MCYSGEATSASAMHDALQSRLLNERMANLFPRFILVTRFNTVRVHSIIISNNIENNITIFSNT
jgi:hypothetical protein